MRNDTHHHHGVVKVAALDGDRREDRHHWEGVGEGVDVSDGEALCGYCLSM